MNTLEPVALREKLSRRVGFIVDFPSLSADEVNQEAWGGLAAFEDGGRKRVDCQARGLGGRA